MKLGINEYIMSQNYGFEKTCAFLSHLGFDTVDFNFYAREDLWNDDFEERVLKYKNIISKYHLKISQMHACWFKNEDSDEIKNKKIELNKKALLICDMIKCPYLVMHAVKFKGYYKDKDIFQKANQYNLELFKEYRDFIIDHHLNVKIAIENMFGYEINTVNPAETIFTSAHQMIDYIHQLGNCFVCCLDTGHAFVAQQDIPTMIYELKDYLKVLHVHDAILTDDSHLIPGLGYIQWEPIIKALKDIHFNGSFSLEIFVKNDIDIQDYIAYGYTIIDDLWKK